MKQSIWFLVKIGIAGGIVWLLWRQNSGKLMECLRSFDYRFLIHAMLLYVTHMIVCGWRWQQLADMLKIRLSNFEAQSLTFQGYFFSLVIPGGAIGGDVVKMGVLAKRSRSGERMEGAFSVLMDRIVGMIALFVLALVLIPMASPLLLKLKLPWCGSIAGELVIWLLVLLCTAGLGASCVIFFHRFWERLPLIGTLMQWGDRRTHGLVQRLTGATDVYAAHWKRLSLLVVIGMLFVHLIIAVSFGVLLMGLHVEFSWLTVFTAVTVGNIVGLLPVFPSGIGGRDFVTVAILIVGGIPEADALSAQLLSTGILLFFNLAGGLFFVLDPGRKHGDENREGTRS